MAAAAPIVFTSGISNSTKTTQTTASFTPTDFRTVVAVCAVRESVSGSPAPDILIANSHAGAWSWEEQTISDAASFRHTLSAFIAQAPATPGSGTVTFQPSESVNRLEWCVFECPGVGYTTNNSATPAISTSATPSVALAGSPASTSIVIGCVASVADTDGVTVGTSNTYVSAFMSTGTSTTLSIQYALTPSSATVDWSGCATTSNLMVAFEFTLEATSLAPSIIRPRLRWRR